jgi:hypothetical protein
MSGSTNQPSSSSPLGKVLELFSPTRFRLILALEAQSALKTRPMADLRGRRLHRDSLRRRSEGGFLQQRDAFDVVRHREDAHGAERERDPLPITASI